MRVAAAGYATRLASFAQEASVSRVYAGLHYRFDGEAGLALGRSVAALALSTDLHAIAGP